MAQVMMGGCQKAEVSGLSCGPCLCRTCVVEFSNACPWLCFEQGSDIRLPRDTDSLSIDDDILRNFVN